MCAYGFDLKRFAFNFKAFTRIKVEGFDTGVTPEQVIALGFKSCFAFGDQQIAETLALISV